MKALVREALAAAFQGQSDLAYVRSLSRMRLAGVHIGDKYRSPYFVRLVETLAMQLIRSCLLSLLKSRLRGLAIRSDFALIWDGVSIGTKAFSRNETLCLIGMRAAHPATGKPYTRLLAAPSSLAAHGGAEKAQLLLRACAALPNGGLTLADFRSSFVVGGADGAEVKGGEDARHGSTGTADILFRQVWPQLDFVLAHWDFWHREEVLGRWAIKDTPLAMELFDVGQVMNQLFGVGQGQHVLRGAEHKLKDVHESVRAVRPYAGDSTRPITYSVRLTTSLLRNFRCYDLGLSTRAEMSRRGATAQSQVKLTSVGRRLTSVDLVVFLVAFHDLAKHLLEPFSRRMQESSCEACQAIAEAQRFSCDIGEYRKGFRTFRVFLFVSTLLENQLSPKDLKCWWQALRCTPWGRKLPTLVSSTTEILHQRRFQGCGLLCGLTAQQTDPVRYRLLHPKCQCSTMTQLPGARFQSIVIHRQSKRRRVFGPSAASASQLLPGGRIVQVPEWVAGAAWSNETGERP